jgi:RNA polymerase sigma-70 factor (ECF subfamily)
MSADSARTQALDRAAPGATKATPAESDEDLLRAYQKGKVDAFRTLVQRHEKPLYRFCLRSLGNPEHAADATQEVFLRIVKHAPRWEQRAKFTTWMYTIARNFCVDEARKGRFRRTDSLNEKVGYDDEGGEEKLDRVADESPDSTRQVDGKKMRAVLDAALEELPEEQREVFCLREYGGLSFKEIAESVGAGENTVKSRMRYALQALRKSLKTAGFHPPDTS